jgi:hypothetical protein
MARGWESKAVADQIEDVNAARARPDATEQTAKGRVHSGKLASLQLSRSRLLEQLERAKHPSHRQVLLNGLAAIEKELEEVTSEE